MRSLVDRELPDGPAVPRFLRAAFEGDSLVELVESTSTLVALDPAGCILWVNRAWSQFARANDGEPVLSRFGPGTSYFDGIAGPLRGFYEGALQNALVTGEPFDQDYECSSPDVLRLHHLRALPFGDEGLLLEHSVKVERPHAAGEALPGAGADHVDAHGLIHQCSNCRRVRRVRRADGRAWDWIPALVALPPANASHCICATCVGYYWGTPQRARAGGAR